MFYGIIRSLGEIYTYLSRARGVCTDEELRTVGDAALIMADSADKVMPWNPAAKLDAEDARDLDEVKLMREHIEEMMVFQLSQEIV